MTEKEREIRMTVWEAMRALWPVILVIVMFFGAITTAIYARAEFAVALARDTEKSVICSYVNKSDYRVDNDRINDKLDYLIQVHMEGKK